MQGMIAGKKPITNYMNIKINKYQKALGRFLVALFCLILWQGCFKFRTSDPEAIKAYGEKNVALTIRNFDYSEVRKIHYLQTGTDSAPTIYFIHGTPGSSNNFDRYLQDSALRNEYRLISIDRPGFGYSNFGKSEAIELQVEMIDAFIRSNDNGQPVIFVGHSLGGPIVAAMASKEKNLAEVVVILAGSVSPELEPKEGWRKLVGNSFFRWALPGAMRPSNDELLDFKKYVYTMPDVLQGVTAEVYILHGTKDMFVPYGNMEYAVQHLKNASSIKTVTFDKENHFIPWSKFQEIKNLLLYIRPQL